MCQTSLSFIILALNSARAHFGMDVPINSTLGQILLNLNLISKLLLGDVIFRDLCFLNSVLVDGTIDEWLTPWVRALTHQKVVRN